MTRDDYREILIADLPLLDVRAPTEFAKGAFPSAENIALLDDGQREQVGICYQAAGNEAALALGRRLICGELKAARLELWSAFARAHPQGALYCFRGGQRSQIVQQWLAGAGIEYPRVVGGYKAMRQFLIERLTQFAESHHLTVVGGRTGTGKTDLINQFDCSIDLEGLAHHRGSGFGRRATAQPAQIDFENRLSIAWVKLDLSTRTPPCELPPVHHRIG